MPWWFEQEALMGGASSGAFRNPLAGLGVQPVETFAREVVQNSVDAASTEGLVRLRFQQVTYGGERLARARELLGMTNGAEILKRTGLLPEVSLSKRLSGPLGVLVVEDFETVGLGGTIRNIASSDDDNYRRLCLQVGSTREGEGGGGSFGFGKAAYWAASDLWTVIFYSRFTPTQRTEQDWARLIGVSWFMKHTFVPEGAEDPLEFTGRAFFGNASSDGCLPFVNEDAQQLAGELGLHVRDGQETGTTVMILGNNDDLEGLSGGVELNWWPRLLQGRLDVEILGGKPPRPMARADLRPFIKAWELTRGRELSEGENRRSLSYNRRPLGELGLVLGEVRSGEESARNEIALMRRPGMVVEYFEGPRSGPSQPICSGAFVADDALEEALRISEPPAHNRWDYRTSRTDRPLTDADRQRIQKIFEKLRSSVREFTKRYQEPPPEAPARCRLLETALGDLFATERVGPQPPPTRDSDPFTVRFVDPPTRVLEGDRAVIDATVDISLGEEAFAADSEAVCKISAWLEVLLDEGVIGERLPMAYMNAKDPKDGEEILGLAYADRSSLDALFARDSGAWRVELRSEPLPHPEYRARISVSVEKL